MCHTYVHGNIPMSQNDISFYMYQNDTSFHFVCMYICIIQMYMVLYLWGGYGQSVSRIDEIIGLFCRKSSFL